MITGITTAPSHKNCSSTHTRQRTIRISTNFALTSLVVRGYPNHFDSDKDKTKSRETSGLDRGKTKQTGVPVCYISRLSVQQQRKNNRSEPKQSTLYLYQHKSNFQNHRMNNLQSTFLILSASFSSNSCCFSSGNFFSLRFRVCVVVSIYETENWQDLAVFFSPSVTPLSTML